MDFAEKMCDHIAIINKGEIILEGSLNELKQKYAKSNVSLSFEGDLGFLKNHSMIDKIENFGNTTGIRVKSPEQIQDLLKLLVQNNIIIKKFDANDISLHEIFVEVAGNDGVALNKEVLNV